MSQHTTAKNRTNYREWDIDKTHTHTLELVAQILAPYKNTFSEDHCKKFGAGQAIFILTHVYCKTRPQNEVTFSPYIDHQWRRRVEDFDQVFVASILPFLRACLESLRTPYDSCFSYIGVFFAYSGFWLLEELLQFLSFTFFVSLSGLCR